MELLNIDIARSVWFFAMNDLNPKGKSLFPVVPYLVDLYHFKKAPSISDPNEYKNEEGLKFIDGEYKNEDGDLIVINLTIHANGMVVETRSSTKDCDTFLNEMLTIISEKYELPHYDKILRNKLYLSQLYVKTKKSINIINPKFNKLSKYLSENIGCLFEVGGFSIWPEKELTPQPPRFIFERVVDIPFNENKYFSSVGLQTEKHLELLNELESIL